MKLKSLKHYYGKDLKGCLRDGDNEYIKRFTTYGFKKSYQMWNDYSHDSIESFFNDFISEYPEEYLIENCKRCHEVMPHVKFDDLFDILLRRLVIDAFIGFKAEDIVREMLVKAGKTIHNSILPKSAEIELDTKYGIDIMTFDENGVDGFFQVKNTSTFCHDGKYIKEKRREFFDKEIEANRYLDDGKYRNIIFYVYDKDAFIREGVFKFFVNPDVDKCGFFLHHLVRKDGRLRLNVKQLKSRVLI